MKSTLLGLLAVALLAGPITANATAVATDGTWNISNCTLTEVCLPPGFSIPPMVDPGFPPWTFTGPAVVTIVDSFSSAADQYSLFDSGSLIGTTSMGASGAVDCGIDPVAALANSSCASGIFALGDGDHSLFIRMINSENQSSGMLFRVQAGVVPEPGTLALLGLGLLGLGFTRRKTA